MNYTRVIENIIRIEIYSSLERLEKWEGPVEEVSRHRVDFAAQYIRTLQLNEGPVCIEMDLDSNLARAYDINLDKLGSKINKEKKDKIAGAVVDLGDFRAKHIEGLGDLHTVRYNATFYKKKEEASES